LEKKTISYAFDDLSAHAIILVEEKETEKKRMVSQTGEFLVQRVV